MQQRKVYYYDDEADQGHFMPQGVELHQAAPSNHKKGLEEDANQHLWAISYSDLLMVIMCFFVVFFDSGDSVDLSPVRRSLLAISEKFTGAPGEKRAQQIELPAKVKSGEAIHETITGVSKKVKPGTLKRLERKHEELVVSFPDNIFKPGSVVLSAKGSEFVREFLGAISEHKDLLYVTFVGHADKTPIKADYKKHLKTNYKLSLMRATTAADIAFDMGFKPDSIATQGLSSDSIDARTLSIIITEKPIETVNDENKNNVEGSKDAK